MELGLSWGAKVLVIVELGKWRLKVCWGGGLRTPPNWVSFPSLKPGTLKLEVRLPDFRAAIANQGLNNCARAPV